MPGHGLQAWRLAAKRSGVVFDISCGARRSQPALAAVGILSMLMDEQSIATAHARVGSHGGKAGAHAAGTAQAGWILRHAEVLDDFLAKLAKADAGAGELGLVGHEAEDVATFGRSVPAEEEVGGAEMEEGEGVALDDLAEVHHPRSFSAAGGMSTARMASQALAEARRWLTGQMPQTRGVMPGISENRSALAEVLEATELGDVETGVRDLAGVIQEEGDFSVTLDAGHRVDLDPAGHRRGRSAKGEFRGVGGQLTGHNLHHGGADALGGRWAARQEDVHRDDFMKGTISRACTDPPMRCGLMNGNTAACRGSGPKNTAGTPRTYLRRTSPHPRSSFTEPATSGFPSRKPCNCLPRCSGRAFRRSFCISPTKHTG